jgi:Carbohydrate binding module (family 6)
VPMLVDYVAVYATGGGAAATTRPPATQPPATQPPATTAPPPASGIRNAFSTIRAESHDAQSGTALETTTDTGGGRNLAFCNTGDWVRYNNVDFGSTPATQFVARLASGAPAGVSGLVEVRLDSRTSAPVGSLAVASTGGWQSWRTIPANIRATTGRHTVFLTFTSGQPRDFVNVNHVTFAR